MKPPSFRIKLLAWLTLLMYLCVAVTLTHMAHPPQEMEHFWDKELHACGYAAYGTLLYIALGLTWPRVRFMWLVPILIMAAFAAADELTQPYFGRDCDIHDWMADMVGVCSAVLILAILRALFATRAPSPAPQI
jgi:VanZ family protein